MANDEKNQLMFIQLVSMFQAAALQQMGKLKNPATDKVEKDMEQAQLSIDLIDMLKAKTKGNLSAEEEEDCCYDPPGFETQLCRRVGKSNGSPLGGKGTAMKFGVIGNLSKDTLGEAVLRLLGTGEKRFIEFTVLDEIAKIVNKQAGKRIINKKDTAPLDKIASECDILIAFGGDGTILAAARLVARAAVPIIGVNLGKLGFLAELSIDEVESFVDDIINNQHVIEDRMVIKMTAEDQNVQFFGVNDIVLDKGNSSRVIDMETYVNNDYLMTYRADGIIVSTPTGSTGYSLATGGPMLSPKSDVLTISPICPHTLSARSVIVPDSSVIRVSLESKLQNVRVTVDGQQEIMVTPPVNFFVQKADYTIKLVKRKDKSYYDVLRSKLMWGKDIRVRR